MPGANGGVGFGSVAPQNPIRGMFWWDGKRLWLFDGAVWVDVVDSAIKAGSGAGSGGGSGTGGGVIISTTPPASPLPGEEWWNGSQLFVWDGTAWKVVGPGSAAGPTPTSLHVFGIQQPTGLSIAATGWSVISFTAGVAGIDPQGMYDAVSKKLTPTKAGLYYFTGRGNSGASGGGVALVKNDSGSFTGNSSTELIIGIQSNTATGWMTAQGFSDFNGTTDYVRLWGRDAAGNWANTGSNYMLSGWLMP